MTTMTPSMPSYKRGDVVLVLFPNSDLRTAKTRPALVVQAENLGPGLPQVIVAMITSKVSRSNHPSRVLVRLNSVEDEPLAKTAHDAGKTPEELAVEWLQLAMRYALNDPLEQFIGAFHSDVPDWADQHDKYLGQALMQEMRDNDETS